MLGEAAARRESGGGRVSDHKMGETMTDFRSDGARKPRHTVRRAERQQPGAIYVPGEERGPRRWDRPEARPAVTLPEIPSLARDIALSLDDGLFMHAVATAAAAMLEGAEEAAAPLLESFTPLTLEQEGMLMRTLRPARRA